MKKIVENLKKFKISIIIIVVVLFVSAAIILILEFTPIDKNRYRIENKYYGFELKTPKNWIAKENTVYSPNNITNVLAECQNKKTVNTSVYEMGAFRFESLKYPDELGSLINAKTGFSSGVILEVSVNCIPVDMKDKIGNYGSGNLEIAGEKALETSVDSADFGKTEQLSVLHNGLQYKINKYVYISPSDKPNENKLRENYSADFNEIISSLAFIK